MTWANGEPLLSFAAAGNHGRYMQGALPELARYIAAVAPRSYGVFQISDDEVDDSGECVVTVVQLMGDEVRVEVDAALTEFVRHTDDMGGEPT